MAAEPDRGSLPGGPPLPPDDPLRQVTGLPLAYGDLHEEDRRELYELKKFVESMGGLRCTGYKERCLRRRIAVRMRARGSHRYRDYQALLGRDPEEFQRLLDTLTLNVSTFFRNPEVWRAMEEKVLPTLFALDTPHIRIWSAGCAGGEEPYTMAILLYEYAEKHGLVGQLERFHIRATDIDRESLASAARGEFGDFAFTEAPERIRQRWFEGTRVARLRPEIRRRVEFGTLDLLRQPLPTDQHLVLCRNVIIYFERDVQEQLFVRFTESVAPAGFLVLGKVETLFGRGAAGFVAVANRERIFRKA